MLHCVLRDGRIGVMWLHDDIRVDRELPRDCDQEIGKRACIADSYTMFIVSQVLKFSCCMAECGFPV